MQLLIIVCSTSSLALGTSFLENFRLQRKTLKESMLRRPLAGSSPKSLFLIMYHFAQKCIDARHTHTDGGNASDGAAAFLHCMCSSKGIVLLVVLLRLLRTPPPPSASRPTEDVELSFLVPFGEIYKTPSSKGILLP